VECDSICAGSTPAGHPQAHARRRELERQSTGPLTRAVRVRAPGDAPEYLPSWRNRDTHRFQKPAPQGMSVRLGPGGPGNQQSGSSAAEQRPHKAKAGGSFPPRTTSGTGRGVDHQLSKEVCHETERQRLRVLSRRRASAVKASRRRPTSSAVIGSSMVARIYLKS
jgi:hypothetical protein